MRTTPKGCIDRTHDSAPVGALDDQPAFMAVTVDLPEPGGQLTDDLLRHEKEAADAEQVRESSRHGDISPSSEGLPSPNGRAKRSRRPPPVTPKPAESPAPIQKK